MAQCGLRALLSPCRAAGKSIDPNRTGARRSSVSGILASTSTNAMQVCGCLWLSPSKPASLVGGQIANAFHTETAPSRQLAPRAGISAGLVGEQRLRAIGRVAEDDRVGLATFPVLDERHL